MRSLAPCLLTFLTLTAARAQTPAPRFEVASIRQSAPGIPEEGTAGVHIDGAQVRFGSLSLRDYISRAYKLRIYQISGPAWLASLKFDVSAKIPDGASAAEVPEMLQSLLEERFGMKLHRETRDFAVYALVTTGKGTVKLIESPADAPAERGAAVSLAASGSKDGTTIDFGKGSYLSVAGNRLEARKVGLASFADTLSRFVDRPVVDMTGLHGTYDFTIPIAPEDFMAMMVRSAISAGVNLPPQAMRALDAGSAESLFGGVEKLGLKLEPRKAPLEFYIVDQIEKSPTAN